MSKEQFDLVATGGTFDEIHAGHRKLLSRALYVGRCTLIGVSSDNFAAAVKTKIRLSHRFEIRIAKLVQFIREEFGSVNYVLSELNDDYGPTIIDGRIQALVVSEETQIKGNEINKIRSDRGLAPLMIITVAMIKAKDGGRLSSSRIRRGEIDAQGNVLKNPLDSASN